MLSVVWSKPDAFAGLEPRGGGGELSWAEGKKEEQQPGANVTRKAAADG